ncbi:MAG: hypothetical protein IMZ50_10380, partial [Candidatus Atribacteria bacterium]|nr:hypothetical protein [Candidatus Atribacteria bacterium]
MFWRGLNKFKNIEIVAGGSINANVSGGRTYFVNNITGSSGNDGLSWDRAMDEVSTAITASEAYRQLPALTTNEYIRNTIYVQGTGTAYTQLTALPSYCDIIGLGADPRGNGAGIARIGPDADTTPVDGVNADSVRGMNVYNIQFQAASGKCAVDIDKAFRCRFENCAFMGNLTAASPTAYFLSGTTGTTGYGASGLVLKDCHFGGASAAGDALIGISIAGTHWHNCLVENCFITGVTGVQVISTCINGWD